MGLLQTCRDHSGRGSIFAPRQERLPAGQEKLTFDDLVARQSMSGDSVRWQLSARPGVLVVRKVPLDEGQRGSCVVQPPPPPESFVRVGQVSPKKAERCARQALCLRP